MSERSDSDSTPGTRDWLVSGLEDDVRPRMFAAADGAETFALATIIASDGGPRPVGAQMVITERASWGFLSGGCIEADVALTARQVLRDGEPRTLIYGEGSPFIDIRLPCGGRIEVAIERVEPDDPALRSLRALTDARRAAMWLSDGRSRHCLETEAEHQGPETPIRRRFEPALRLVVIGSDPFALAIAGLGRSLAWDTSLLSPFGPGSEPPFRLACDRRALNVSLAALDPDPWTAIAVATHDLDADHDALVHALASPAGYVGVLGSRRKLAQRLSGLRAAGLSEREIARLHAPIGLPIDALSPWEVAVAVAAQIIESSRSMTARGTSRTQDLYVAA